jgi:hypothetical protein
MLSSSQLATFTFSVSRSLSLISTFDYRLKSTTPAQRYLYKGHFVRLYYDMEFLCAKTLILIRQHKK